MSDDERPVHGASGGPARGGDLVDPVVLPEHASAYYSPRSPPAATEHRTLEVAAVRLDQSVDPRLADTRRVSVDGLEPPPWLALPARQSDAPTVLLPIVRARRLRKRAIAAVLAALLGSALGVWFGLVSEPAAIAPPSLASQALQVPSTLPASTETVPSRPSPVPPETPMIAAASPTPTIATAVGATGAVSVVSPRSAATGRGPGVPRRAASASSAWLKSGHPKAWIK